MKNLIYSLFLIVTAFGFMLSCDTTNPANNNNTSQLNKFVAKINGKDTIMGIFQAKIKNFAKSSYKPAYQQLTIITNVSNPGVQIDFYVNDTTIKVNKSYPIDNPFTNLNLGLAYGYYRMYSPGSGIPSFSSYATTTGADYKAIITELSTTKVKGNIKYLTNGLTIEGVFYSDKLVIE